MQSILKLSAALKERIVPKNEPAGTIIVYSKQKKVSTGKKFFKKYEDHDFSITTD